MPYFPPLNPSVVSVLGVASLRHASVDTTINVTTTGLAVIDATNLSVTFVAPSNGIVLVECSGFCDTGPTNAGALSFGVLDSSPATVSKTLQLMTNVAAGVGSVNLLYRTRATGLTAGTSYTWRWAAQVGSGQTGHVYHGPTYGELLMRVLTSS